MTRLIYTILNALCSIWLLLGFTTSSALELVIAPIIAGEVIHDQLSPASFELNKHFPNSYIHVPEDIDDYLARHDKTDITYADESYGSILVQEHNYIPLLRTNEVAKVFFASLTNYNMDEIARNQDIMIAANRNDLLLTGLALRLMNDDSRFKLFDRNTNLIIRLLKNENMVGVLPEEDLMLLPTNLKNKVYTLHQRKLSPFYLLINPKHKSSAQRIQGIMHEFHKNWDRSQSKYVYLNYYTLRKVTSQDIEYLNSKERYIEHKNALSRLRKIP